MVFSLLIRVGARPNEVVLAEPGESRASKTFDSNEARPDS